MGLVWQAAAMSEPQTVPAPAREGAIPGKPLSSTPPVRPGVAHMIPWTLIIFLLALPLPWLGSRYDTFLGTQIAIDALFAVSLNLLLGTTGLVSFGHVAYFGIGAYVGGILMKTYQVPFALAFPAAGLGAALAALVFGYFCVRLTRLYFAMLTLAFSQIVWAVAYKWDAVTGGDQGVADIPYPDLHWMSALPGLADLRIGERFYLLTVVVVAVSLAILRRIIRSPFGRMLTTIRDNPERAAFIGVNVRAYELAAFVVAGGFAGLAGLLYGIFSRGVFPDYVFWSKSAEVIIMAILGGVDYFWGPPIGALALVWLDQKITDYTQYWPFVLGIILLVLLFGFPGGIAGGLAAGWRYLRSRVSPRRA
jgi:branched-chain amino acid transport system permease protein